MLKGLHADSATVNSPRSHHPRSSSPSPTLISSIATSSPIAILWSPFSAGGCKRDNCRLTFLWPSWSWQHGFPSIPSLKVNSNLQSKYIHVSPGLKFTKSPSGRMTLWISPSFKPPTCLGWLTSLVSDEICLDWFSG